MKAKPPPDRRKFADDWDEIGYLNDKLLYWLYERQDTDKARAFARRLEVLLANADADQQAILGQECRSLVSEAAGDLGKAIKHRENEIRLIRRLKDSCRNTAHQKVALADYGDDDLSDRLDLLATLYHDSGNLDKAIATLEESKQLCKAHGLKFDGEDLLEDYLKEQQSGTDSRWSKRWKPAAG